MFPTKKKKKLYSLKRAFLRTLNTGLGDLGGASFNLTHPTTTNTKSKAKWRKLSKFFLFLQLVKLAAHATGVREDRRFRNGGSSSTRANWSSVKP